MNFKKLLYITILLFTLASCKKDEDAAAAPGLDGYLKITGLPEFIAPGETRTMRPQGALHPEGEAIGYYWKVTPSMTTYDTTEVFEHKFDNTLQTYTVYCYAYASGYSGLSASSYTTVVAPGYKGSITGIDYQNIAEDSVKVRHMQYYYKKIGTQTWTLNNMAVRSGIPFRNAEVMSEVFGRYYSFSEAKAACDSLNTPDQKWKLPSLEDWNALENYISQQNGDNNGKSIVASMAGNVSFNNTAMWEYWPAVGRPTNASGGFSAIPTGYANIKAGSFTGDFEYAAFWTSTEVPGNEDAQSIEGYYKYMICDEPGIFTGIGDKESFGASVRCIKAEQ